MSHRLLTTSVNMSTIVNSPLKIGLKVEHEGAYYKIINFYRQQNSGNQYIIQSLSTGKTEISWRIYYYYYYYSKVNLKLHKKLCTPYTMNGTIYGAMFYSVWLLCVCFWNFKLVKITIHQCVTSVNMSTIVNSPLKTGLIVEHEGAYYKIINFYRQQNSVNQYIIQSLSTGKTKRVFRHQICDAEF
jgi:translation elongation factor P/translation initiation factor 5A